MTNLKIINSTSDILIETGWQNVDSFKTKSQFVDENGSPLDSTYRGIRYQVVAKHIREFGVFERIGRIFLGVLYTIVTLGFAYSSETVQKLVKKTRESLRFGLEKGGAQQYADLKTALKSHPCRFYILNRSDKKICSITATLGKGGSKEALQINDKVLMVPNMDVDSPHQIARRWARIVDEEVMMSTHLTSIGLLSLPLEKVDITLSKDSDNLVPAYTTKSFESLARDGCSIVDTKNEKSSTWKGQLFANNVDPYIPENWDQLIKPLLTDIAKITYYGIPLGLDSRNFAVVKEYKEGLEQLQLRYFGFDFSSKQRSLIMPERFQYINDVECLDRTVSSDFKTLMYSVLTDMFYRGEVFSILNDQQKDLAQKLLDRYKPEILRQIRDLAVK